MGWVIGRLHNAVAGKQPRLSKMRRKHVSGWHKEMGQQPWRGKILLPRASAVWTALPSSTLPPFNLFLRGHGENGPKLPVWLPDFSARAVSNRPLAPIGVGGGLAHCIPGPPVMWNKHTASALQMWGPGGLFAVGKGLLPVTLSFSNAQRHVRSGAWRSQSQRD